MVEEFGRAADAHPRLSKTLDLVIACITDLNIALLGGVTCLTKQVTDVITINFESRYLNKDFLVELTSVPVYFVLDEDCDTRKNSGEYERLHCRLIE